LQQTSHIIAQVPTLQLLTMKFSSAAVALVAAASGASAFCPAPTSSRRPTTSLFASDVILKKQTGYSSLDPAVIARYNALPFPDDKILAEYVWVDADGNTRSKTRTLDKHKVRLLVVFCVSV
jgi:glutamine synthetase